MTQADPPRRSGTILGRVARAKADGAAAAASVAPADGAPPDDAAPLDAAAPPDEGAPPLDDGAPPDPAAPLDTAAPPDEGAPPLDAAAPPDDAPLDETVQAGVDLTTLPPPPLSAEEVTTDDGGEPARALVKVPWTMVAVVGLAVVTLLLALLALQQRNQVQHDRNQTRDLKKVSGQLVGALTTYDYQHLDQWRAAVLAHATGSFRNGFNDRFQAVSQVASATHNRATSNVEAVYVGDVQAGRASTLAVVVITVTGLTGTRQLGYYITLSVLKVNGQWQVDDLTTLNFDPTTGTSPTPGGATATTLPGTPPSQAPSTAPATPSK